MRIQIREPSELFKPFIQYYKYIATDLTGVMKIVPNTFDELYFNFTHINLISPGYYAIDNPRIHLAGLHHYGQNCFTHMYGTDRKGGFAVVFQTQGFYRLFNIKSSDFSKYVINDDSFLKEDMSCLWEGLYALYNIEEMKNLFENHFSVYAKQASRRIDIINKIVSYMDDCDGIIRVSKICDLFNVTPRTLDRCFKDEIGMSPKELLNIFRINKSIKLISENPDCDLTELSYLSGYYDQSHFIKEIRKITGIAPGHIHNSNPNKVSSIHNLLFISTD